MASPGLERLKWWFEVVERIKAKLLTQAIEKWSGDGCAQARSLMARGARFQPGHQAI